MMRWLHIVVFLLLSLGLSAQVSDVASKSEKRRPDPKKEQRQIDEQLASRYYQEQDYEKAAEIYKKLYNENKQSYQFFQYVDCLVRQKDFNQAEKELKAYSKKNPNQSRSQIELMYVYKLDNESDKADKLFKSLLKDIPDSDNELLNVGNLLRSRGLNDEAIAIFEKGSRVGENKSSFNMELAYSYQAMANYQEAFKYYFLELEEHPGQYNIIKNRLQSTLFYDVNSSIADELRIALLKQTQEKPDNLEFAQLLVWFALQQEDYDIALEQCKSLDKRTDDQDSQINNLSNICLNNKQFDLALNGFEYLCKKGKSNPFYAQALTGMIDAEYQKLKAENVTDTKTYAKLTKRISEAYTDVSTNELTNLVKIQADIEAYYLGHASEAITLLQNTIETVYSKQSKAELKLALADIYLYGDEVWEATLLYGQVDKSMKEEPLGHEARFKNAQLRYFIGEYAWAETQLHVLKAATSKLIANDAMSLSLIIKDNLEEDTTGVELKRLSRADYRIYQKRDDEALSILDSIVANGNETSIPHALFRQAEIAEKRKQFATAEQLYLQIVSQYPFSYMADHALMNAALLEHNELKMSEEAKQHYEALIDDYPTSIYTAQAKKNYRKL